jgi:hypothetical protein
MDLGAKQVVLLRICSQLQYQSKMTEIPKEAFVKDCIVYDAVAKKINKRCHLTANIFESGPMPTP